MSSTPTNRIGRRVLYLSPNSKFGGAEQVTLLLARYHQRENWEPQIYFLSEGPLVPQFESYGIRTHLYPGPRPRLRQPATILQCVRHLARVIRQERIELVHSVMSYGHILGGLAAQWSGVPEVWFQHGPTGRLDWVSGRIPTRTVIVNSRFIENQEAQFHPQARKTRLIYPGIESSYVDGFHAKGKAFRQAAGFTEEQVVFGLIARIAPMKGHHHFIDAAARVAAEIPNARFMVVGGTFMKQDAAYELEIRARVAKLGLGKKVAFTGFIPFPQYSALAACDVIVNASADPEPFGMTLIEGMTLGKPVIAPRMGGPMEIISDGRDGFLFETGNPVKLAEKMMEIGRSPDLRARLGAEARRTVAERFTVERMVREMESEYAEILEGSLRVGKST